MAAPLGQPVARARADRRRGASEIREARGSAHEGVRDLLTRLLERRAEPCRTAGAGRACRSPDRRTDPRPPASTRDRGARHDPDAHRLAATRVDVASVLERLLGGGGVHAARVFVRRALRRLHEHFPERPLRVVAHAASPAAARFAAYAVAASRTHAPSSCAARRAASRSRLHGPSPLTTRQNSSQSIGPNDPVLRLRRRSVSVRIGERDVDRLRLRDGEIHEPLAQLVVGLVLHAPAQQLRGVRRILVARTEHHERRPPPAIHGVLRHRALRRRAGGERRHDLVALALVEVLFLADAHHRARVRPVRRLRQHRLVHDRRAVDEPADAADVGPRERRVVEDARVLRRAVEQLLDQRAAVHAERLGAAVDVEPVTGLVLHLGERATSCAADSARG